MAGTRWYGNGVKTLAQGEWKWTDDIRCALVGAGYTPDQDAHDYWNDVVANEVAGTGYTAGGFALISKSLVYDSPTNALYFKAGEPLWISATFSARYAVFYSRTPATDAARPLIGWIDFTTVQSPSGEDFRIVFDTLGVFRITAAA